MKLCKDCKHCEPLRYIDPEAECFHPSATCRSVNLVTGQEWQHQRDCSTMREEGFKCGPDGKLFEPRERPVPPGPPIRLIREGEAPEPPKPTNCRPPLGDLGFMLLAAIIALFISWLVEQIWPMHP